MRLLAKLLNIDAEVKVGCRGKTSGSLSCLLTNSNVALMTDRKREEKKGRKEGKNPHFQRARAFSSSFTVHQEKAGLELVS